jgi:predicted aminopeptidase
MALFLLSGCSTVSWYGQAVQGQLEIWQTQQPLDVLLENPETEKSLVNRLETAKSIRRFAVQEMKLPDNGSYSNYADLQREAVLWAVFAAADDSVDLKQWCYLLIGCVGYRGFFAREKAVAFAQQLQQQGLDVFTSPVPAYSTLGWFKDPLLNTFIHWPEPHLVELILHELAHQQLYIDDDSSFNESFATAVAEEGVRRWLKKSPSSMIAVKNYQRAIDANRQIIAQALKTRIQLKKLYASKLPYAEKMALKQEYLKALHEQINALEDVSETLVSSWQYEKLNNARLGAVATYYDLVPAFENMIEASDGDMQKFYQQAKKIGRLPLPDRHQKLAETLE